MSETKKAVRRYKTTNWATYNAVFGLALRQSLAMVQSMLHMASLNWRTADFSTLSRRQKTLQVQRPYQRSATALDLLVDSSGIKFLGEGEWKRKKHGAECRCQWRKVHLGIDANTPEIRAIDVTDNSVGNAPMLPALLAQIPQGAPISRVSGDGTYDTKGCHAAIASAGAQPFIPLRKNDKPWSLLSAGGSVRNEAVLACKRLDRTIWEQWAGDHRRSLVETKMHGFKRLGERVMSRTFERQVVELYVRIAYRGVVASGVGGCSASDGVMQQSPYIL